MIPMTHPDLKIRVSLVVEILRLKIPLGTQCSLYWNLNRPVAWQNSYYGPQPFEKGYFTP